jgi:hypothetical protein
MNFLSKLARISLFLALTVSQGRVAMLMGQDAKPRERSDRRDAIERDPKAPKNESLGREGDRMERTDEKLNRDGDQLKGQNEKLAREGETSGRKGEKLDRNGDNLPRDEKAANSGQARADETTRQPKADVAPKETQSDAQAREEASRQRKTEILQENQAKGKAWEARTGEYLKEGGKADPKDQVTIESRDGVRSRADYIYRDNEGRYVLVECKASEKADYTTNQREVFNSIRAGEEVTVRGNKMGPQAPDGSKIRIDRVYVARPDANGNVRMEAYQERSANRQ